MRLKCIRSFSLILLKAYIIFDMQAVIELKLGVKSIIFLDGEEGQTSLSCKEHLKSLLFH